MANVSDPNYIFRVGGIKMDDQTKVYWQGDSEWLTFDQLVKLDFIIERGYKIAVYKKGKETGEIKLNHSWDTDKVGP